MKKRKRYISIKEIDQTQTPEFKKWFGNSKVVKNGKPLIVYHGTNRDFTTFKAHAYFTSDIEQAKGYAKFRGNGGYTIIPAYLNIKNPANENDVEKALKAVGEFNENLTIAEQAENPKVIKFLKSKGFDGIMNIWDFGFLSDFKQFEAIIPFYPNQIKSAVSNNGNFNKNSNNIYESFSIPLNKNDRFLYGKFKNKSAIYDHSYINEKGDLIVVTDTGKEIPAMKLRLVKEELHLSDFQKHAGASDFTKDWIEIRRKIVGAGNKSSKIHSMKVNRKKDYITFLFKSIPTYDTGSVGAVSNDLTLSKKVKQYTQEIRIQDFFKLAQTKPGYIEKNMTASEIKEILKVASIKVFCDDPSFQFQGMNFVVSTFDASVHPELRAPKVWNRFHNDDNFLCKHLSMIFNSIAFYLNPMTSMINSYLKK